jgi:murein L,D-transpeptidase YafK
MTLNPLPPMKIFVLLPLFASLALVSFIHPVTQQEQIVQSPGPNENTGQELRRFHIASSYYIVVDKSDYELKVYDEEGWYATYPIVFGSRDLGDKMKEGDKKTPDGQFKVIQKKMHPKWGPELLLDYPNDISIKKFNERKIKGLLPKNAKIGGGIAIHATRPEEEWTVDNFYNWTDGCISVKYTEMKDLFSYIPIGTPVTIQR